jgi:hypothetical protein
MNKQNDPKAMENLKAATRQLARLTWQMAQAGAPLKGEQATLAKVMREHPEYADIWEHLDELSDAEIECDGVNPIIHVQMHAVVENQIAGRNPTEVREIVKALMHQGYSRHDAIHAVAGVLAEEMFFILRDQRAYDETGYLQKLQKLVRGKRV